MAQLKHKSATPKSRIPDSLPTMRRNSASSGQLSSKALKELESTVDIISHCASKQSNNSDDKKETPNELTFEVCLKLSKETKPSKVYEINASSWNLTQIQNLEKFTLLRVLDLSFNKIREIVGLTSLKELRELRLYGNQIFEITGIEHLTKLVILQLQLNQIESIGGSLKTLRTLETLRLDDNQLYKITARELVPLGNLKKLDLSRNKTPNILGAVCLTSLESLRACGCEMVQLPTDFSKLKVLSHVDFSKNHLESFEPLVQCPGIVWLNLSKNHIQSLEPLAQLVKLEVFYADNNSIESFLPLQSCTCLEILDLSTNALLDIDELSIFSGLPELYDVNLSKNYITEHPEYRQRMIENVAKLSLLDDTPIIRRKQGVRVEELSRASSVASSRPVTPAVSKSTVPKDSEVDENLIRLFSTMDQQSYELTKQFENFKNLLSKMTTVDVDESRTPVEDSSSNSRPLSQCSVKSRLEKARSFVQENGK